MSVNVMRDGHVGLVEVDRPPANHFDMTTMNGLVEAVERLDADSGCRALVLASTGRHFSAGMDFSDAELGEETARQAEAFYSCAARLFDTATPLIAAVQGAAVGGGLGLACAADFRVADADTRFVANFALLGFHQGFGLSVTLPALVGGQAAADMLYTGRRIGGRQAVGIGLADRLAEPGETRTAALRLAEEVAASAPLAVASIRNTLRGDLARRVRTALAHELEEQRRLWATNDAAEGVAAALQRRTPAFNGS
ncbi:enoyl-CoA hydratase/isomerase family protein [Streptomyces sp. HNM0575]|uniref:enoyl-CoA hydratase/isomerase family protein n=1 Tax=Streptomyces sp. HNM0575 TaxID=2716338 RepID=UPI00145DCAD6|nr:enoyl-CoA hydratase/isomerase family protein [Streptomyces sp. HNM0575]NLU74014.1 enoyl-CoA hydratase/isomerase family protein [Streptomyces sp. HNM0575]